MDSMFSSSLISKELQSTLPHGFIIRPLCSSDYEKGMFLSLCLGFLECLSNLTIVGNLNRDEFLARFYHNKNIPNHYYTIVIEDANLKPAKIAAAGTIFIEYKFLHHNGLVGHIEDIVVSKEYRGKNFGKWIIDQLKHIGNSLGCYKIILDCSEKNLPFYQKCGFEQKELEMVMYLDHNDKSRGRPSPDATRSGNSSPSKL